MAPPTLPPPPPGKKKSGAWLCIVAAIAGIALIVAVGAVVVGGFMAFQHFKQKRAATEAAFREMQQTAAEEREKMADSIQKGEIAGGDQSIGRMKQQLEKSAAHMSRDDAAAARALAVFLDKMQAQARAYDESATRMIEAEVLGFKFQDRATLAKYRQLLVDFSAANDRLTNTIRRADELARAELVAAKVPERTIEATMGGFNKGRGQRQLQLRIREYDRILGQAGMDALDLLEKSWGQWSRDRASGQLVFQNDATLATFNELIAKIQSAAAEQTKVQQELAVQMKAMGKP